MFARKPTTLSFDHLVWLSMAAIAVAIAIVLLRGDQLRLQAVQFTPAPDSSHISTQTQIQIRFDQPVLAPATGAILFFMPPLTGDLQVNANQLTFTPATPLQPYTTYTATLNVGLRGEQGGRLHGPLTWHFVTGGMQVVYSAVDAQGQEQLYVADAQLPSATDQSIATTPLIQLAIGPLNVWDFSVMPQGGQIIYAALKEDGTSDLWQIRPGDREPLLFVPCPNAVCSSMAWSPNGKLLAYARRNATEFGAAVLSPPRLWLFDVATGESVSVFTDNQKLAFEPDWSADGEWLTYLSPDVGGVGVVNLQSGDERFYLSDTGETGIWHPEEIRFVYSVLSQRDTQYVSHLIMVDPVAETTQNLSGEAAIVEDNSPVWSPDGTWLALRRKELSGSGATPGKQIWHMRSDGSEATPLTSDPAFDHGQPQWSPDGRYLLFHKLPLKGPEITLSVWIVDVETGKTWEVARPGQRPLWLP